MHHDCGKLDDAVEFAESALILHAAYLRKISTRMKMSDGQDLRVLAAKLEGLARDLNMHRDPNGPLPLNATENRQ